jgi:nicotinamidase-related amidase
MPSEPIRDPAQDHLLTPKNSVLIIIDYQPVQVNSVASMDRQLLINNIVGVAKIGLTYGLPIIHSTVNVKTGLNKPPIPQLSKVLEDLPTYDRTSINSWEDVEFVKAVKATGRRKLVMNALWTEACLSFPALDALREGYEVYPVVDAVGGTSLAAHEAALRRIEQAGGKPISWAQLLCELQRDWSRTETVPQFIDLFIDTGGTAGIQFADDKAEAVERASRGHRSGGDGRHGRRDADGRLGGLRPAKSRKTKSRAGKG